MEPPAAKLLKWQHVVIVDQALRSTTFTNKTRISDPVIHAQLMVVMPISNFNSVLMYSKTIGRLSEDRQLHKASLNWQLCNIMAILLQQRS